MLIFEPTRAFKIEIYSVIGILAFFSIWVLIAGLSMHRFFSMLFLVGFVAVLMLFAFMPIPFCKITINNDEVMVKKFFFSRKLNLMEVDRIEIIQPVYPFNFFGNFIILRNGPVKVKFSSRVEKYEELWCMILLQTDATSWPIQTNEEYRQIYSKH